jgi:hypothetical protein
MVLLCLPLQDLPHRLPVLIGPAGGAGPLLPGRDPGSMEALVAGRAEDQHPSGVRQDAARQGGPRDEVQLQEIGGAGAAADLAHRPGRPLECTGACHGKVETRAL